VGKRRRRNPSTRSRPQVDGIPVGSAEAPAEGSDAGDNSDLREAYVLSRINGHRSAAKRHFARAKRLVGHSRVRAETEARTALDRSARAFWWAEETPLEEEQHLLMHQIGRWTRSNFGCWLDFEGGTYKHRCPVAIAHKRIGNSMGFTADRICSLCGGDLSECPHHRGRTYWVRSGPWEGGACRVCLEDECRHRPNRLYRASVVSIIKNIDVLREVSLVRRPAQPEARLTELPVSTADLRRALGPRFKAGMPVSCDRCLGECQGIEDPFLGPEELPRSRAEPR
jgi:hypothetical protein